MHFVLKADPIKGHASDLLTTDTPAVWLYSEPVDMRKSINGLSLVVVEIMEANPQTRQLYLFRNKRGNRLKGLLWDRNGFVLLYKVLEQGRFHFPKTVEAGQGLTSEEYQWLLAGLDVTVMRQHDQLDFTAYS